MVVCLRLFYEVRTVLEAVSISEPLNGDSDKRCTENRGIRMAFQGMVETRIEYPVTWLVHFFKYDM